MMSWPSVVHLGTSMTQSALLLLMHGPDAYMLVDR